MILGTQMLKIFELAAELAGDFKMHREKIEQKIDMVKETIAMLDEAFDLVEKERGSKPNYSYQYESIREPFFNFKLNYYQGGLL